VDGLMAVALVAGMVLEGRAKKLAFSVLGAYTLASLILNHLHGVMPVLHQPAGAVDLPGQLVLLAASLPVGAIFFGSDLVARLLKAEPKQQPTAEEVVELEVEVGELKEEVEELEPEESPVEQPKRGGKAPSVEEIRDAANDLFIRGEDVTGDTLAAYFGVSGRTGRRYLGKLEETRAKV
jgi:hypothetical protein